MTSLFASADYGLELLLNSLREQISAGKILTTPEIAERTEDCLQRAAELAARQGFTDSTVSDMHAYAIMMCATAIQNLLVNEK